ncbi:hypothetical protein [Denitrobaculum tricleocarpae]|uniref:Uncharacterized protein n=1 Tax=Denitrobaculum tricleocarpae TaxID=2591009 RepID=A0A545TFV7_9PROT|nr:hypothetical protein [Denitrobaculum tricleocarpae]TQV76103.1 hypothetical protein FKG95_20875 [Denitrobaculum tricleocarpae]
MIKLHEMTVADLLSLHTQIGEEFRLRGISRSANALTGDLAEYLFCNAFDWEQAANSAKGYDAIGKDQTRYQIKGRRVHRRNKSRQLSAIREIEAGHFDVLAGVLFDDDFKVRCAALIPRAIVQGHSKYNRHTNSNRFMLSDNIWSLNGVQDVTNRIRALLDEG